MLHNRVHISTLALVTIGMFDLLTTLLLLGFGMKEANPVFSGLLSHGILVFSLAKVLLLGGPILILEFARKTRPLSAEIGTWVAAGLYAYLYVSHLLHLWG